MRGKNSYLVLGNGLTRPPWNVEEGEAGQLGLSSFSEETLLPPILRIYFLVKGCHLVRTQRFILLKLGYPTFPVSSAATPKPPAALLGVRTGVQPEELHVPSGFPGPVPQGGPLRGKDS